MNILMSADSSIIDQLVIRFLNLLDTRKNGSARSISACYRFKEIL
jgi:hypothetical protein